MNRPDAGLYEATKTRMSRRKYSRLAVDAERLARLAVLARDLEADAPGVRIVVRSEGAGRIFEGRTGYGLITGAISYAAFIARDKSEQTALRIGSCGEWLVLEATRLGLSTCWVAGTFRRAEAESQLGLAPDETLLCVTPLGEADPDLSLKERTVKAVMGSRNRKPLAVLCPGVNPSTLAPWQQEALACARNAPSAVNLQPWRFDLTDGDRCRIRLVEGKALPIAYVDLGICMLHFTLGALHAGVPGNWVAAPAPHVAAFVPENKPVRHGPA